MGELADESARHEAIAAATSFHAKEHRGLTAPGDSEATHGTALARLPSISATESAAAFRVCLDAIASAAGAQTPARRPVRPSRARRRPALHPRRRM